jgi:D-3-phosphoglycerate dehydrogenase
MKKILANDGIDEVGKSILEKAGYAVITEKVAQENLAAAINENNYIGLTVRSASKVRKDLIDSCPGLKLIARGGVGMDNIDVDYAKSKGIIVANTPAASSNSVAELVMAHLFTVVRFLHDSNRKMPLEGGSKFADLKKKYAEGTELSGKTIGIIGFGRIGQTVARHAIGIGMKVKAYDPFVKQANITLNFFDNQHVNISVETQSLEEVLKSSDFITLHVPGGEILGAKEFDLVKKGAGIINTSRGEAINESALLEALNNGKVAYAGLDVFENEPTPSEAILNHPKISLTPHIGAATMEAQERIGVELAEKIIEALK